MADVKASTDKTAIASCKCGAAKMTASIASTENRAIPHSVPVGNIVPEMSQCEAIKLVDESSCRRKNGRRFL